MREGLEGESLRGEYLAVLRRRKWFAFPPLVLVPLLAVFFTLEVQKPHYRATAQVLINSDTAAARLLAGQGGTEDPARMAQTQATLARGHGIARAVLDRVGLPNRSPQGFLKASDVTSDPNADLLNFSVTDPSPSTAIRLATAYADEFASYRNKLDFQEVSQLRSRAEARLAELRASGDTRSPLYATLASRVRDLAILEGVPTTDYVVTDTADRAVQVSPRPVRTGLLGLLVGCALALGLMLLAETRDRAVRSAETIRRALRLPVLARLQSPTRQERADPVVMLSRPNSETAERFRTLRTNLQFANIDIGAKTIMFTSAVKGEGKSTVVANLAVAMVRAGYRVALVDLDVRRPRLQELLRLDDRLGLTQVACQQATLKEVLQPVPVARATGRLEEAALMLDEMLSPTTEPSREPQAFGQLDVLGSGPAAADLDEFFTQPWLVSVLQTLRSLYDLVLIDAPPLLGVSDAAILSGSVDALVVVTRLGRLSQEDLEDLVGALDVCRAVKLGFVITAAELSANERGKYHRGYYGSFGSSEQSSEAEQHGVR